MVDLVWVVNYSADVNVAQVTAQEDGSVVISTYDWQQYLATYCTKLTGIKKLHHLRFHSDSPGCVFVKEKSG